MKQTDLAAGLGISQALVSRLVKRGMPTDKLESARAWRAAHCDPTKQPLPPLMPPADPSLPSILLSRQRTAHHEANLAEMKEKQRAGELVLLADVRLAYTTLAADFRAALERIPDKVASRLAAESDPHAVHSTLMVELDQALFDMARAADQLPARLKNGSKNQAA